MICYFFFFRFHLRKFSSIHWLTFKRWIDLNSDRQTVLYVAWLTHTIFSLHETWLERVSVLTTRRRDFQHATTHTVYLKDFVPNERVGPASFFDIDAISGSWFDLATWLWPWGYDERDRDRGTPTIPLSPSLCHSRSH